MPEEWLDATTVSGGTFVNRGRLDVASGAVTVASGVTLSESGSLGEGAAIATAMVPFLLAAILVSYFGLQRRAWQQGAADK